MLNIDFVKWAFQTTLCWPICIIPGQDHVKPSLPEPRLVVRKSYHLVMLAAVLLSHATFSKINKQTELESLCMWTCLCVGQGRIVSMVFKGR